MNDRSADRVATVIGVDIGTSGVRAAAIDDNRDVVAISSAPFQDAASFRSPAAWWENTEQALRSLATAADLTNVRGIAVDGTSGTVLGVDDELKPIGRPLMYNDTCPDPAIIARIEKTAPADSAARGSGSALARGIYLARHANVTRILHQADWILGKLGLQEICSDENNSLKTGYDLEHEAWPAWIEEAGLDLRLLPRVVRAGASLARVDGFAHGLGLAPDCHFHAGTTDGCASFIATGASEIGDAVTALGSTMVLKLASGRPVNAPQYGVYSHRVLDFWLPGGASNTGGAVIKSLFGDERLSELTAQIDPSRPTGLNYYPLNKAGERFPVSDPLYPPRLEPRPANEATFFQAVLEGIMEIERMGYERLVRLGSAPLKTVRTVGGGAKNTVWASMRERTLGVPFAQPASVEAAVGTAALVLQWEKRKP
ncbi:FGGY-family carbohydrate kinase [Rhizobium sp. Root1220]|uniref:FGGY-family carbohydrate kinase n=1 Tax=Rhizobium sp. Root1220 TaxID=1736432 RepID=UPI0006FDA05A|nr:FGGY-family carbohydrate kinase [Rhizobium sp. Root1220]KQV70511.1 carbohydrate kinase [Rhizobium sp. Root1220]